MMLPFAFQQQMQALLGVEYQDFMNALQEPAPVSIRYAPEAGQTAGDDQGVPWHPQACYLSERPVFTLDPRFHAGAYYVQEASSMFLYEALRQSVDFSKPLNVLDLCAAPGGKSTLAVSMMNADSLLVSNEVIRTRVGILRENMEKWGYPNIAVVSAEAEVFSENLPAFFNVVIADAPCSGEGLFRKDPAAVEEWSPAGVDLCAGRQRRILAAALETLAPGGVLAYSTCTFNRQENEENSAWLRETFGLELLRLQIPSAWGIVETDGGYRFFPHRVRGEGFFIALFRKKEAEADRKAIPSGFKNIHALAKNAWSVVLPWLHPEIPVKLFQTPAGEILALPAALESNFLMLDKALKNKWFGVNIGEIKGQDFIPSHALAESRLIAPGLPAVDLSREQALLFLKKETFDIPADAPRGWTLARFDGLNLGWMKVLPNRINNYLPVERRIRMPL